LLQIMCYRTQDKKSGQTVKSNAMANQIILSPTFSIDMVVDR
jgi:hypothetical protein